MLKKSITVIWAGVFLCSLVLLAVSLYKGYPGFISMALGWIDQQQHVEIALSFVSAIEYRILQGVTGIWIALLLLAWIFRFKWYSPLMDFLQFGYLSFRKLWHEVARSNAKYFLIIPFTCAVWHAITMPVTYDESWTYIYFTINGPLVSSTFYPAPNNHILFSLISNLSCHIPFLPPLVAFRISSIIFSMLSWSLLWYVVKKKSGEQTAGLILAVVSTLFMSMYYSYMARGYALVLLFFILSSVAVVNLLSGKPSRHYAVLYILANVLGGYTMPSYLYAFASFVLILVVFKPRDWLLWGKIHCLILASWLLLYLPIFIVNGTRAVTHNAWVQSIPFEVFLDKIGPFLYHALQEISGLHAWISCMLLFVSTSYLLWHKCRKTLIAFLILLATPVVMITMQTVIPYPRSLVWMTVVLPVLILMPFEKIWSALPKPFLIVSAILLQIGLAWTIHGQIKKYDSVYRDYHDLATKIAGDQKSYYFNSRLFDTTFAFEMQTRGFTFKKAANFYPTIVHPMSADTIDDFDYIIIERRFDETRLKKPIHVTKQINVYK